MLDGVFRADNFRNEIIWKRKAGRGETNNTAIRFGVSHDTLLFYAKTHNGKFLRQHRPNKEAYIEDKFTESDADGRLYHLDNLTSPSYRPNLIYEYKGYQPPEKGWAVSLERMKQMDAEGRLYFPDDKNKRIRRKRYLDQLAGELRHSREITILCSAKVTQHHARAGALLPLGKAVCRWASHRRTGRAATPGWLIS